MFSNILFLGQFVLLASMISAESEVFETIEKLVTQWSPLIWLAPQEKFLPLNVEEFLNHVNIVLYKNTSKIDESTYVIDSEGYNLVTKKSLDELFLDKSSFIYGKDPVEDKVSVYAIVTECFPNYSFHVTDGRNSSNVPNRSIDQENSYPHFHVSFWLFYPYNEGKEVCIIGKVPTPIVFSSCIGKRRIIGNHVGDWEHISLYFSGNPYPDKMYVAVHDAGVYYKYQPDSRLFKYEKQVTQKGIMQRPKFPPIVRLQGNHPILFSAYGSHGMWGAPGDHYYVRVPRLIDKNGYGTAWETWKSLKLFHLGISQFPFWLMFKGKWGNPQSNCFLFKDLGICELSDGPKGILNRKQDFYCFRNV